MHDRYLLIFCLRSRLPSGPLATAGVTSAPPVTSPVPAPPVDHLPAFTSLPLDAPPWRVQPFRPTGASVSPGVGSRTAALLLRLHRRVRRTIGPVLPGLRQLSHLTLPTVTLWGFSLSRCWAFSGYHPGSNSRFTHQTRTSYRPAIDLAARSRPSGSTAVRPFKAVRLLSPSSTQTCRIPVAVTPNCSGSNDLSLSPASYSTLSGCLYILELYMNPGSLRTMDPPLRFPRGPSAYVFA